MLDRKERQKLDDAHDLRLKQFFRAEVILDSRMEEFEQHPHGLMEKGMEAFRAVPDASASPYLYKLEENLHDYRKEYNGMIDDILEQRYHENRSYYQKLDEK